MKVNGQTKPSQLDRLESLEKAAETLSMGVRVSQMLVQQLMGQLKQVQEQLHIKTSAVNELQYRQLALQKLTGVDLSALQKTSDEFRLEEWNRISLDDSKSKELVSSDKLESRDQTVVFSSSTPELPEDRGIFRSKVKVSELGSPEAESAFIGKSVGDTFAITLADHKHLVTILEILTGPTQEAGE